MCVKEYIVEGDIILSYVIFKSVSQIRLQNPTGPHVTTFRKLV